VVREDNADNPDGHFPSRYSKWFKSEGYRPRSIAPAKATLRGATEDEDIGV
jgi:hypothetical protein